MTTPSYDPRQQAWVSTHDSLPALGDDILTTQFIESSLSSTKKWQPDSETARWDDIKRRTTDISAYRQAAVLVPMIRTDEGIQVVLTLRSSLLRVHSGQISFPGGSVEPQDNDLAATALRETYEEIGLSPERATIIGELLPCFTVSSFTVQPYAAWIGSDVQFRLDRYEVDKLIIIPLSFLMDPANHRLYHVRLDDGTDHYYYGIEWHDEFVWGATASIIRNFYQLLRQHLPEDTL